MRSFDIGGDLKRDGVPFVFITGYDQEVISERSETSPAFRNRSSSVTSLVRSGKGWASHCRGCLERLQPDGDR